MINTGTQALVLKPFWFHQRAGIDEEKVDTVPSPINSALCAEKVRGSRMISELLVNTHPPKTIFPMLRAVHFVSKALADASYVAQRGQGHKVNYDVNDFSRQVGWRVHER